MGAGNVERDGAGGDPALSSWAGVAEVYGVELAAAVCVGGNTEVSVADGVMRGVTDIGGVAGRTLVAVGVAAGVAPTLRVGATVCVATAICVAVGVGVDVRVTPGVLVGQPLCAW